MRTTGPDIVATQRCNSLNKKRFSLWQQALGKEPQDPQLRAWLRQKGSTTQLLSQQYQTEALQTAITHAQWLSLIHI